MNKYKVFFGVEIHAELLTKTKAFSPAKVNINDRPNTNIHPIDIGYPGVKPIVNKKMLEFAYRIAKAFDMKIAKTIRFDRKNYFYPDLANGYQLTQFFEPIATQGKFVISTKAENQKEIFIRQIQMEEDTAKQINKNGKLYLDFNRAGIPLIEIITGHNSLSSIEEVLTFVKQLREQLIVLEVNDGNLHEGSFRIDVNVSLSKNNKPGERVEIKNLNSFNNIKLALEYEINLQKKNLNLGKKIKFVTKRFDEKSQKTIEMRKKDTQKQYNFIPEGNINPIKFERALKQEFDQFKIFKINTLRNIFFKNAAEEEKQILLENLFLLKLFIKLPKTNNDKKIINFLIGSVLPNLKNMTNNFKLNYDVESKLLIIMNLLNEGKTTKKEVNELVCNLLQKKDITLHLDEIKNKQIKSNENIEEILNDILSLHSNLKEKYKINPKKIEKFLMGQLMKETKGQIKPQESIKIIKRILNE